MAKYRSIYLVGGGAIAQQHHIPRLLGILQATHLVIQEPNPARNQELHRFYEDEERIQVLPPSVQDPPGEADFDLVVIATPNAFHFEYYQRLEDRACRFLIEKPVTLRVEDAEELVARSERLGKTIFVHLPRRALGIYSTLGKLWRSQVYGRLVSASLEEGQVFDWGIASWGLFSRNLTGGGVLMDNGPNPIDTLLTVFDSLEVCSAKIDGEVGGLEANCLLELVALDGAPVKLNLSRNRWLSNQVVLQFDRATLSARLFDNKITVRSRDGSYLIFPPEADPAREETIATMIDAFYFRFLKADDNEPVSPRKSLATLKIIESAYARATRWQGLF